MDQKKILPKVLELCKEGRYDDAIALTNEIEIKAIAVKAHFLCIEHEKMAARKNNEFYY